MYDLYTYFTIKSTAFTLKALLENTWTDSHLYIAVLKVQ